MGNIFSQTSFSQIHQNDKFIKPKSKLSSNLYSYYQSKTNNILYQKKFSTIFLDTYQNSSLSNKFSIATNLKNHLHTNTNTFSQTSFSKPFTIRMRNSSHRESPSRFVPYGGSKSGANNVTGSGATCLWHWRSKSPLLD